jgi:release factor glutamine methyltransferase
VELRAGSLFDVVADGERFAVIVSNPPYVAEVDRGTLAPEVVEHEPAAALFAGADGLEVIDLLVAGAWSRLRPGGLLALEVGFGQSAAVLERLERTGQYVGVSALPDLAGRDRMVLAERPA